MRARPRERAILAARRVVGPAAAGMGIRFFDVFYGERDIDEIPPPVQPPIPLEVRAAQQGDVDPVLARIDADDARRIRQVMLRDSEVCLVASSAGTIAGFICASESQVDVAGLVVCELPAGGAYIHNTHVLPEFRGRKVMQALARAVHLALVDRGCRFTCRLIDRTNAPSLIGTERAGIRYRWAPVLKLPGVRPFFVPPAPKMLRVRSHRTDWSPVVK